jgi:hypothetical protein
MDARAASRLAPMTMILFRMTYLEWAAPDSGQDGV